MALAKGLPLRYIGGMRRDEFIARQKDTKPAARGCGVGAFYLVDSHARDEAEARSDLGVFVDPGPVEL